MAEKRQYKKNSWRWLAWTATGLYILVALLCSSIVQSYLGAAAGSYLSSQWGGKVRIGAIHFSPIACAVLHKIELISPSNDTIFFGDQIACSFRQFPFSSSGLHFDRVEIRNSRYHFASEHFLDDDSLRHSRINLSYIIDHYKSNKPKEKSHNPFNVEVGDLILKNVDYIMDLPTSSNPRRAQVADSLAALPAPRPVSIPHMRWLKINGRIRDVSVHTKPSDNQNLVQCRILSLATIEAGGFEVKNLTGKVEVSPSLISVQEMDLTTGSSHLLCNARLDYDGWESMSDYCHNVWHDLLLKPGSRVNVNESAWWAPTLWGVNCPVELVGHCYGTIDDLHIDSLQTHIASASHFSLMGTVSGLPEVRQMMLDLQLHDFLLTTDDVATLSLPGDLSLDKLMKRLNHLQYVGLDAELKGNADDIRLNAELKSGVGDINAEGIIEKDALHGGYAAVARLRSDETTLRDILGSDKGHFWLLRTGLDLVFEGRIGGVENPVSWLPLSGTLDGKLKNTSIQTSPDNQPSLLAQSRLSATLDKGLLRLNTAIDDSLLQCTVSAVANLTDRKLDLHMDLDHAHLASLGLVPKTDSDTQSTILSSRLRASLQNDPESIDTLFDMESLRGHVTLSNTRYGSVKMNRLALNVDAGVNGEKDINLSCDWLDLRLKGWFDYADFPAIVQDFSSRYLPGGSTDENYNPSPSPLQTPNPKIQNPHPLASSFDIDVSWTDRDNQVAALLPGFSMSAGSTLHGSYSYAEGLKLILRSEEIEAGGAKVRDLGLSTGVAGNAYALRLKVADVAFGGIELLQNLDLRGDLGTRISTFTIAWHDQNTPPDSLSDLEFFLTSTPETHRLSVTRPLCYLLGERWTLVCPEGVIFRNGFTDIPLLKLYGTNQSLSLKASIGHGDEDFVKMNFVGFPMQRAGEIFLAKQDIRLDGILDGTFELHGIGTNPYFEANLDIDEFKLNGQSAGKLELVSNWAAEESRLYVDVLTEKHFPDRITRPVELHGSMLVDGTNTMDFNLSANRVSLQTVGPMLASFTSNIDGYLSGDFRIYGTPGDLSLNGAANVQQGLLHVDVTGVTYYFDDSLQISNDTLTLQRFAIHDPDGNTALVDGHIVYDHPELLLDLALSTPKIQVLDSKSMADAFYGRLLVSAQGSLKGSVAHPVVNVRAATLDGSTLHVPVDNKLQVSEGDYIHFLSYDRPLGQRTATPKPKSNVDLQIDLTVTPGLRLFLPMDFSEITADVEAVGRGDLRLNLSGGGNPTVLGDYEFSSGRFSLSLLSLIEKNFSIEQGSSLTFPGNLNDARFDIRAVYNQRVNLSTLTGASELSSSDAFAQIQNVIALAGTFQNPSIKFDIRLPNADQTTVDQINSLIDLSNDQDMLNHTVSLLLLGRFANTGTMGEADGLLSNGINSINVIASSLSSIVSNAVKVVDVNFKVQQGTATASSSIDVGISKQWEKLYFESSFGYGTGNTSGEYDPEYANVLVGDVVVGYRIKPWFSFYGFNRSNTSYYTRSEIPYKQGLGFKWTLTF